MGWGKDIKDTLLKLSALEKRTEDVQNNLDRIGAKIDDLQQRVTRVETKLELFRESLKSQIMGDIKADLAVMSERLRQFQTKESQLLLDDTSDSGTGSDG